MGRILKVRILLTVGIFPPDIGGPATHIPRIANEFYKRGDSVTVVALRPNQPEGYKFHFQLKLINRNQLLLRFFTAAGTIFIEAFKAEKIYSNGLYAESVLPIRILRKPAVAKIVGDPVWERARNKGHTNLSMIEFQSSKLTIKNRSLRALYRFIFNSYSSIVCPSQELAQIVKEWGIKSDVSFIPNGVPIPKQRSRQKEFDLIYVGRLVKWKNIDKIIYVSSKLNLKTLIVGSGPENQELRTLAALVDAPCFFVGEQEKEKVHEYLQSAKIFILLSQYEGQSFALLEAFAAGIPAIVSNVSGNLATVTNGEDGLVINAEDLESFLPEIEDLIGDEERLRFLGCNARHKILNSFSEERTFGKIIELVHNSK